MKDCNCKKKEVDDTWLDKNDYGDEFLREESYKIIYRIGRDKNNREVNQEAIFNIKLEENEIDSMNLEDVKVDYSYLKNKNFKVLNEDKEQEIDLLEETGETSSDDSEKESTDENTDVQEEDERKEIKNIPNLNQVLTNIKNINEPIIIVEKEPYVQTKENQSEEQNTNLTNEDQLEIDKVLDETENESEIETTPADMALEEEKQKIKEQEYDIEFEEVSNMLDKRPRKISDKQIEGVLNKD